MLYTWSRCTLQAPIISNHDIAELVRFHRKRSGMDKTSVRYEKGILVLFFSVWCKDAVNTISTSLEAAGA